MSAVIDIQSGGSKLGADFDKLLVAEKARVEKEKVEAPLRRAKRKAEDEEKFRACIATALVSLDDEKDDYFAYASVAVRYARGLVPTEFINELVARGYYVTRWVHTGQFLVGAPIPCDYIQIFRIGAYKLGNNCRDIYCNMPCELL